MPLKQQLIAIAISLTIFIFIIGLVKAKKLRADHSWIWLITGSFLVILSLNYNILIFLTNLIGATIPTSTLFFGAIMFLIILCLQFSIRISSLTEKVNILSQEITILNNKTDSE